MPVNQRRPIGGRNKLIPLQTQVAEEEEMEEEAEEVEEVEEMEEEAEEVGTTEKKKDQGDTLRIMLFMRSTPNPTSSTKKTYRLQPSSEPSQITPNSIGLHSKVFARATSKARVDG